MLAKLNTLLVTWSHPQKFAASSVRSKMATSDAGPESLDPPNTNKFFCLGIFWLSSGIEVWTELFGVSLHPSPRLTTYPWKNILKISLTLMSTGQVVCFHSDHLFCKLYFFFILPHQCYGALPTLPSTGKTSAVCPLQHWDGNLFAYLFPFFPANSLNQDSLRSSAHKNKSIFLCALWVIHTQNKAPPIKVGAKGGILTEQRRRRTDGET